MLSRLPSGIQALADLYPATGDPATSPSLWLSSVTHTGQDGAAAITLPPTSFSGTPMPDRVQTPADQAAGYSLITRPAAHRHHQRDRRHYRHQLLARGPNMRGGHFPRTGCEHHRQLPGLLDTGQGRQRGAGVVQSLCRRQDHVTDTTGGGPPVTTSRRYNEPAWHYDDDTISRSVTTTWDQWRGYRTVTTETGDGGGAAPVQFLAEVVVLDGEHVYDPGEGLAHGAVAVAFLPQALDPGFQRGDLLAQPDLADGDAVTCLDLGGQG